MVFRVFFKFKVLGFGKKRDGFIISMGIFEF